MIINIIILSENLDYWLKCFETKVLKIFEPTNKKTLFGLPDKGRAIKGLVIRVVLLNLISNSGH